MLLKKIIREITSLLVEAQKAPNHLVNSVLVNLDGNKKKDSQDRLRGTQLRCKERVDNKTKRQ